ncbi:hypothetical protein [Actinosynnema sp.]|uniref:hypothetical protein n=1 Tax=Actinosynnema sp. TaxID=1872144 RepID=UPI003F82F77D
MEQPDNTTTTSCGHPRDLHDRTGCTEVTGSHPSDTDPWAHEAVTCTCQRTPVDLDRDTC